MEGKVDSIIQATRSSSKNFWNEVPPFARGTKAHAGSSRYQLIGQLSSRMQRVRKNFRKYNSLNFYCEAFSLE